MPDFDSRERLNFFDLYGSYYQSLSCELLQVHLLEAGAGGFCVVVSVFVSRFWTAARGACVQISCCLLEVEEFALSIWFVHLLVGHVSYRTRPLTWVAASFAIIDVGLDWDLHLLIWEVYLILVLIWELFFPSHQIQIRIKILELHRISFLKYFFLAAKCCMTAHLIHFCRIGLWRLFPHSRNFVSVGDHFHLLFIIRRAKFMAETISIFLKRRLIRVLSFQNILPLDWLATLLVEIFQIHIVLFLLLW